MVLATLKRFPPACAADVYVPADKINSPITKLTEVLQRNIGAFTRRYTDDIKRPDAFFLLSPRVAHNSKNLIGTVPSAEKIQCIKSKTEADAT